MHAGTFGKRPIEVKKNSASAHVLGLSQQFANGGIFYFDDCG
jgi:hypothetical protein